MTTTKELKDALEMQKYFIMCWNYCADNLKDTGEERLMKEAMAEVGHLVAQYVDNFRRDAAKQGKDMFPDRGKPKKKGAGLDS